MIITAAMEKEFSSVMENHAVGMSKQASYWMLYKDVRDSKTVVYPSDDKAAMMIIEIARKHNSEILAQGNALAGVSQPDSADARQAGGDHYKKLKVQPWDAMEAWLTQEEFRGFLKGNIIKYIARANSGKEDHNLMIEKAAHYQQKLDEMLVKWKSS